MNKYDNNNKEQTIIRILLFFLLPYLAINSIIFFLYTYKPEIIMKEYDLQNFDMEECEFDIKSLLPITNISILKNDTENISYRKENKHYYFPVDNNGTYKINIKSINQVLTTFIINLSEDKTTNLSIDTDSISYYAGILSFNINKDTKVNFDNVYLIDPSNNIIRPNSIEEATNNVQFKIDNTNGMTIHIEDIEGNSIETSININ